MNSQGHETFCFKGHPKQELTCTQVALWGFVFCFELPLNIISINPDILSVAVGSSCFFRGVLLVASKEKLSPSPNCSLFSVNDFLPFSLFGQGHDALQIQLTGVGTTMTSIKTKAHFSAQQVSGSAHVMLLPAHTHTQHREKTPCAPCPREEMGTLLKPFTHSRWFKQVSEMDLWERMDNL